MNWSRQNNVAHTRLLTLVTVVTVFLVVVNMASGGFMRRALGDILIVPAYWGEQLVSGIRSIPFIAGAITYRHTFQEMESELGILRERNTLFTALQDENASLRKMLTVLQQDEQAIVAAVISPASSRQFGTLLINAGSAQGIRDGDIVLSESGYALGEIENTGESSAQVRMYFAPRSEVSVTARAAQFTLVGRGGGNARAQVPRELPLSEGEVLYAPMSGARPVSIVGHLSTASSSAFMDVYALVPVQLETLRFVLVVRK